ncbi:MAG: DUF4386 domain-containing protein [Terracidiphilus sp.]
MSAYSSGMSSKVVSSSSFLLIDPSQRNAARAVGIFYLITNALAWFAEFHVRGTLIDYGSITRTVANITAHQQLFRLGLACELLTFACDLVIIVGLYVILKPVNGTVALLGIAFRLVETAVVAIMTLTTFDVLRLVDDPRYQQAFGLDSLQAMVSSALSAHDAGYNLGFLFFGVGSTAFTYLWFKSRYIPKPLAACGILGSILTGASTFVYALSPHVAAIVEPACFIPIGTFELAVGLWLVIRGLAATSNPAVQSLHQ